MLKGWPKPPGLFVRKADFTAFSSNRLLHPVRRVTRSEIKKRGREITYTIEADGFLRYMVRTIVGTLLEVGRGRIEPRAIEDFFARKKTLPGEPDRPCQGPVPHQSDLLTGALRPDINMILGRRSPMKRRKNGSE